MKQQRTFSRPARTDVPKLKSKEARETIAYRFNMTKNERYYFNGRYGSSRADNQLARRGRKRVGNA
jgi:hypothetical protein